MKPTNQKVGSLDWPNMIKAARQNLCETQEEFAKRFDVSTNTISRWETGEYKVSLAAAEWLFRHAIELDIRICPRCGGRGLVCEPIENLTKENQNE